jgi:hypothetical protein
MRLMRLALLARSGEERSEAHFDSAHRGASEFGVQQVVNKLGKNGQQQHEKTTKRFKI